MKSQSETTKQRPTPPMEDCVLLKPLINRAWSCTFEFHDCPAEIPVTASETPPRDADLRPDTLTICRRPLLQLRRELRPTRAPAGPPCKGRLICEKRSWAWKETHLGSPLHYRYHSNRITRNRQTRQNRFRNSRVPTFPIQKHAFSSISGPSF